LNSIADRALKRKINMSIIRRIIIFACAMLVFCVFADDMNVKCVNTESVSDGFHARQDINDRREKRSVRKENHCQTIWEEEIVLDSMEIVKQFSGKGNYYTLETENDVRFFRAHYVPSQKVSRLGYMFSDSQMPVEKISWKWRLIKPPLDADERVKGKNDSGAGIYMIFKDGMRTYIIKYVFSTVVPKGTVIRKDPMYPVQQMNIIVADTWDASKKNMWDTINVDICQEFRRVFGTRKCPQLRGFGILTDGDETNSEVVADYSGFTIKGSIR